MIISKLGRGAASRWLATGALSVAACVWPAGMAQAQDVDAVGARLRTAVRAGELSADQARAMMETLHAAAAERERDREIEAARRRIAGALAEVGVERAVMEEVIDVLREVVRDRERRERTLGLDPGVHAHLSELGLREEQLRGFVALSQRVVSLERHEDGDRHAHRHGEHEGHAHDEHERHAHEHHEHHEHREHERELDGLMHELHRQAEREEVEWDGVMRRIRSALERGDLSYEDAERKLDELRRERDERQMMREREMLEIERHRMELRERELHEREMHRREVHQREMHERDLHEREMQERRMRDRERSDRRARERDRERDADGPRRTYDWAGIRARLRAAVERGELSVDEAQRELDELRVEASRSDPFLAGAMARLRSKIGSRSRDENQRALEVLWDAWPRVEAEGDQDRIEMLGLEIRMIQMALESEERAERAQRDAREAREARDARESRDAREDGEARRTRRIAAALTELGIPESQLRPVMRALERGLDVMRTVRDEAERDAQLAELADVLLDEVGLTEAQLEGVGDIAQRILESDR